MDPQHELLIIIEKVYDKCSLELQDLIVELESNDYNACSYLLSGRRIICRNSKITSKKCGQFVTFWKRNAGGPIAPFDASDEVDFFVVNTGSKHNFGQFVFPKTELIKRGIISTKLKEGKRAIRVYPPWDKPSSQQAVKTQQWQLKFFLSFEADKPIDVKRVKELYAC